MGESARRKRSDPTYGRFAKGATQEKRGIVVCPPMVIDGKSMRTEGRLDKQELRFSLLFWDELAWPATNGIFFGGGPDEAFLEKEGVLTRPHINIQSGSGAGELLGLPHLQAFRDLDAKEPGKWSLATGERSFQWTELPLSGAEAAVVELHRAIPVPDIDVPLAEILEFKGRRADQIGLLRAEMERCAAVVRAAENHGEELIKECQHVERACLDLLRVGKEWQFPMRLSDIKVTFETKPGEVMARAIEGAALSHFFDFAVLGTFLAATVGGVLASGLKISGTPRLQGLRPRPGPYQYVYSFHKELF